MQAPVAADAEAAHAWRAPSFNFYDKRLLGGAWMAEARPDIVREFFRVLAVCHTVIPDGEELSCALQAVVSLANRMLRLWPQGLLNCRVCLLLSSLPTCCDNVMHASM